MKKTVIGTCTLVLWGVATFQAGAQQAVLTSSMFGEGPGCAVGCCDEGEAPVCGCEVGCGVANDCDQSGLVVDTEMTLFRYHHSEGIVKSQEFDFEAAPRITLGFRGPGGLGIRGRWWKYDHSNSLAGVETYNIDVELFEELQLSSCTTVELSGGFRYNGFNESGFLADSPEGEVTRDTQRFNGFGGVLAIEANRSLAMGGSLYTRLREAILMDDWHKGNTVKADVVLAVTEIAFGYEFSMPVISSCYCMNSFLGIEWQNWHGFDAGNDSVGFAGIVTGFSLEF
ncbi:MAG: hypothetical protein CMJ81_16145 [Planctomycetaceae bacterium]|jgi:hypothetical protein|nr:hypothetical protein [Planctomycetaceae bacterium]MBP63806.1 hypothetical protein [Planctomycetaceae bacterium]